MSYCRWSTDNYGCDIYAYESDGGYETHVASLRVDGEVPPLNWDTAEALFETLQAQNDYLDTATRSSIGGPFDGESFTEPTLEGFLERLLELRRAGYKFPDSVITEIQMEIDHG